MSHTGTWDHGSFFTRSLALRSSLFAQYTSARLSPSVLFARRKVRVGYLQGSMGLTCRIDAWSLVP